MSFLDLYQGDQEQAARMQPNEGTRLPSGFEENFHAAWSDGLLFSQSIARANARSAVLSDYVDEIKQKTGNDLSAEEVASGPEGSMSADFARANERVAKLKENYPDLDLAPLSEDEIDKRALAKAQASHKTYQTLQQGEKTWGGSFGTFAGSAASAATDPINIVGLAIAPETGGISILSSALRWGALAGVSQAAIEAASDTFKEQVQPGYTESGEPIREIGGAFLGGAVLGGTTKALGNAWTRVKTGQWPTSVRDAGNVIESEANVANTNPFPGVAGEVAHREALVKTIDDILAGRPVDVSAQITPELQEAAAVADRQRADQAETTIWYQGVWSGAGDKPVSDYWTTDLQKAREYSGPGGQVFAARESAFPPNVAREGNVLSNKILTPGEPYSIPHVETLGKLSRDATDEDFAALAKGAPKQLDLPLAPDTPPVPPKRAVEPGPQPITQTPEEMAKTLTAPDHQDAIRADIDRELAERATGSQNTPRATFTTAKGSVYSAFEDGTTIRNKAARPDVGHEGDSGIKDRSARTIYVDGDASVLSGAGLQGDTGGKGYRVAIKDDKATFLWWNEKEGKWGAPASGRDIPFTTKPEVGKSPVELWKPATDVPGHEAYRGQHAGNKITSVTEHPKPPTDIMVPGVDENGNHTMSSVNAAVDEVDAYKKLADDIQACAAPAQEAAE